VRTKTKNNKKTAQLVCKPQKPLQIHNACIMPARVLLCINGSFSEVYTLLSPEINKIFYLQDNDLGVILVHF